MMPKGLLMVLVLGIVGAAAFGDVPPIKPSRGRPFFMPESKRKEILELIRTQAWAKDSYEALKAAARGKRPGSGDGFAAAFLYALEGDPADAATAEQWLMSIRGKPSHHRQRLEDPDFWKGGQTMQMSEIHYGTDPSHYVAFDWAYNGLSEAARKAVYQGLLDETQYRMKWLDTWRYTPNLEFKPLYMAAFGGLTLQDSNALRYLLGRKSAARSAWHGGPARGRSPFLHGPERNGVGTPGIAAGHQTSRRRNRVHLVVLCTLLSYARHRSACGGILRSAFPGQHPGYAPRQVVSILGDGFDQGHPGALAQAVQERMIVDRETCQDRPA